jgi:chromosome segregation ATPase
MTGMSAPRKYKDVPEDCPEALKDEVVELNAEIARLRAHIDDLTPKWAAAEDLADRLRADRAELEKRIENYKGALARILADKDLADAGMRHAINNAVRLHAEISKARAAIARASEGTE